MKKILFVFMLMLSLGSFAAEEHKFAKLLTGNLIGASGEDVKTSLSDKKHIVLYWSSAK